MSKPIIALFNYGGGIRGLIPAHMMARIEEVTGLRMAEMVDIFCGPSTGSILNAALNIPKADEPSVPKFRARHMVRFYEREGIKIFPPDRFRDFRGFIHDFNNRTMRINQLNSFLKHGHYDPRHLYRSLKNLYGDFKLNDSLNSLIIPIYNIDGEQLKAVTEDGEGDNAPVHKINNFLDEGGHALWLKKMDLKRNRIPTPDVPLYDAVMASCAAPSYFPCHHFKVYHAGAAKPAEYSGIDGSIYDNPCITYFGAIRQHLKENQSFMMFTLGTGFSFKSIKKEDWNRYGGLGVVDPVNDLPLINIFFHAPESALVESFSQEMEDRLYVFNKSLVTNRSPETMPSIPIDDASPENLKKMERFAQNIMEENSMRFQEMCHHLVRNRDHRQRKEESLARKMKRRFYFLSGH